MGRMIVERVRMERVRGRRRARRHGRTCLAGGRSNVPKRRASIGRKRGAAIIGAHTRKRIHRTRGGPDRRRGRGRQGRKRAFCTRIDIEACAWGRARVENVLDAVARLLGIDLGRGIASRVHFRLDGSITQIGTISVMMLAVGIWMGTMRSATVLYVARARRTTYALDPVFVIRFGRARAGRGTRVQK